MRAGHSHFFSDILKIQSKFIIISSIAEIKVKFEIISTITEIIKKFKVVSVILEMIEFFYQKLKYFVLNLFFLNQIINLLMGKSQ